VFRLKRRLTCALLPPLKLGEHRLPNSDAEEGGLFRVTRTSSMDRVAENHCAVMREWPPKPPRTPTTPSYFRVRIASICEPVATGDGGIVLLAPRPTIKNVADWRLAATASLLQTLLRLPVVLEICRGTDDGAFYSGRLCVWRFGQVPQSPERSRS